MTAATQRVREVLSNHPTLAGAGVGAATLLYSLLVNSALTRYAARGIEGEKLDRRRRSEILREVGADPRTPIYTGLKSPGESAFVPKESVRGVHDNPLFHHRFTPKQLAEGERRGLIITSPNTNEAILAHEAGHVADYQENKKSIWPYQLSLLAAPLVGGGLGYYAGKNYGALAGIGAGTLGGLATAAPALIDEFRASQRADKLKDTSRQGDRRSRLGAAYLTYLGAAGVPGALSGGLGGFVKGDW